MKNTQITNNHYSKHLFICTNQKDPGKQCCANSGGKESFNYLKTKLKDMGLHGPGKIRISQSGCLGRCSLGPCIVIYPEGVWYTYRSFSDIDRIIQEVLIDNCEIKELLIE